MRTMFGPVERFIGIETPKLGRARWYGDQVVLGAPARFHASGSL
jgi:hypothetical protein